MKQLSWRSNVVERKYFLVYYTEVLLMPTVPPNLNLFCRILFTKIKGEDPYAMLAKWDFNGHSQIWWPCGDSTTECIDLIFTDQPNVVLESGTRSFLDPFCHHQMTHCRFNFKIPSPPPFTGKIWSYDKTNVTLIRKSISDFPLENHFRINPE